MTEEQVKEKGKETKRDVAQVKEEENVEEKDVKESEKVEEERREKWLKEKKAGWIHGEVYKR